MGALEAVECPEPRLGGAEARFCARALGNDEACPPSRHSQLMSRLATTITIPVMSTAKQEKSRRSPHLDIPRFGLRLMPDSGTITNYFAPALRRSPRRSGAKAGPGCRMRASHP